MAVQTIVADCSPLIALSAIRRLSLLRAISDKVLVPPAVYREAVTDGQGWTHARDLQEALAEAAWRCLHPRSSTRRGRVAAGRHGVEFFGILGVLARVKGLKLIAEAKPLIEAMEKAGYRFHSVLKKNFLERLGEV